MSYFMRYICTNGAAITLAELEAALQAVDPRYRVEDGTISLGEEIYGSIKINHPGDGLFENEIEELQEAVRDTRGKHKRTVLETLQQTTHIVAVQILFQDRDIETTLQAIDPLWAWLFAHRQGLLQADGEGYYTQTTLLLKVED